MDFVEKVYNLASKVKQQHSIIKTEEATKNAFVLPFISNVLGYDVFDPSEVMPEFICDVGTKKGEKIDYAILKGDEIQILIECKKIGESLTLNNASQLFRYFHVTSARIAILTNGQIYKFYTDLDAPNKMDEKPFLEMDLFDIDDHILPELKKITKEYFDVESIINAAEELKYVGQIKKIIAAQVANPTDDFVRFFSSRVYEGVHTQKIREQFSILTRKALAQFLNDQINERLKIAITGQPLVSNTGSDLADSEEVAANDDDIITTLEEVEGFHVVKAIVRSVVESNRVISRDTKSYYGILLDDNNRKPICRLHFNRSKKYIGLFDDSKNEVRYEISSVDEIYNFADQLKSTATSYG